MLDLTADELYVNARDRGLWTKVWSALTGRPRRLLALAEINATCTVHARHHAGMRTVSLGQIRGSEGRSKDFDRDFNPLQNHSARRWISIATARQEGKSLPPVELIRVGDVYFVRDGHHRISVARALGQRDIEAQVAVWQVSGPLPWQSENPRGLMDQETGIRRLYKWMRDGSGRLQERFLRPSAIS